MDRIYNVEKSRKRKASDVMESTPKKRGRPKRSVNLESRYPSIHPNLSDELQDTQHQAIEKELQKDKPRKDILLPLMKSTFYTRRQAILRSDDTVTNKLEKYSALKMPPLVNFVVLSSNIFLPFLPSFLLSFYLCVFLYTSLCPSTFFLPLSFLSFLPSFFLFFHDFHTFTKNFLIYLYLFIYLFIYIFIYLFTYSYLFVYLLIYSVNFLFFFSLP